MIIDAHAHACGEYVRADAIIQQLDAHQVDKVVLVPGELNSPKTYALPDLGRVFPKRNTIVAINRISTVAITLSGAAGHIHEGNRIVHTMASTYPERIVQFYWVSIGGSKTVEEMREDYKQYQFKGLKLHQCWQRFRLHGPIFESIIQFAVENGLPLFIHVWSTRDLKELLEKTKEYPELRLIVAHLFGFEAYARSEWKLKNVYFEISSPSLISEYRLQQAIQQIGANRLVMGTDIPYGRNNLSRTLERIRSSELSAEERELILGQNMADLLA